MNRTIYFDGICNLCNRGVQFIIKRDPKKKFRFASLQGEAGQNMLKKYGMQQHNFDTFILQEGDKIYTRSTAALRIVRHLKGGWKLLYGTIIIPRFIRNAIYNWIAKRRYKWFGKKDKCLIPSPELKERFYD